ncbi:vps901 [Candida pseudojiufengensis]|uniref:vps901 n=1 Tax=Candida pseudojiufengensis TaxID=497109 RepID=UPI00222479C4|nr:vps901 [Candida pseudojiufengensis]KAI5963133.1 vps901 [Candida pseudojiufengensis]
MSFNSLAFNVSKSTPTTSTNNTNTTSTKSSTSNSDNGLALSSKAKSLSANIESTLSGDDPKSDAHDSHANSKANDLHDESNTPHSTAHAVSPSFGKNVSNINNNYNESKTSSIKSHPSNSKLGFSPTLTAPPVVTIASENNDKLGTSKKIKDSAGTKSSDLIGLFDKFDIKSSESGSTSEIKHDNNQDKQSDNDVSIENEKYDSEHEQKLEKMQSDDEDLIGKVEKEGTEKMIEVKKPDALINTIDNSNGKSHNLSSKKMDQTAYLSMTIQPYNPPELENTIVNSELSNVSNLEQKPTEEESVDINNEKEHLTSNSQNETMELSETSTKAGSNITQKIDSHHNSNEEVIAVEEPSNLIDNSRNESKKTNDGQGQGQDEVGYKNELGQIAEESKKSEDLIDSDKIIEFDQERSEDTVPKVPEESSSEHLKGSKIEENYNKNVSSPDSSQSTKNELGDIAGDESEDKGIEEIVINNEEPSTEIESKVKSRVSKTPLKIKYKVNPNEQHQQSHKAFDFQNFLVQLRKKPADPIVRYLRSFLGSYIKQVHSFSAEQRISIITDFKSFTNEKFKLYEPFASMDSIDLENSREGLEKLIMNRLYDLCFPPEVFNHSTALSQIPQPYQDDLKEDKEFSTQLEKYSWINGSHFDIDMTQFSTLNVKDGQDFFHFAILELNKINNYRAPRDKIICILNSCKIIFSYLKLSKKETNADSFIPLLILVILKAKTSHLISNIHYIENYRGEEWLLHGETSYYLSSIQGAISFIQNLSREDLTIRDEEFDAHMEAWDAELKQREKQEKEEMEKLRQIELQRQEFITQQQQQQQQQRQQVQQQQQQLQQQPEQQHQRSSRPSTPKRRLSQPQPRRISNPKTMENVQASTQNTGISPSNVLFSSAEMFTRSISNFLSPSPQPNTVPNNSSRDYVSSKAPISSPPPPALPPRSSQHSIPQISNIESSNNTTESTAETSNIQYQPEPPAEEEINSEQMKNAYEVLKEVFPTLDTNILKDVIFINKGDVDVCIDACLPLVDG